MQAPSTGKNYSRTYPWAQNQIKLNQAVDDLEHAKKLDPTVIINEDTIKERYIIRKGNVKEVAMATDTQLPPDNTEQMAELAPMTPRIRKSSNKKTKDA